MDISLLVWLNRGWILEKVPFHVYGAFPCVRITINPPKKSCIFKHSQADKKIVLAAIHQHTGLTGKPSHAWSSAASAKICIARSGYFRVYRACIIKVSKYDYIVNQCLKNLSNGT